MFNFLGKIPSFEQNRRIALDLFCHQMANAAEFVPYLSESIQRTDIIKDVPYRDSGKKAHLLDIYRPKNKTGPLPVLIYIHGGGFTLCSKETHRGCALIYARSGFLVFNINYRLAPAHPFPAALTDACHAFHWVTRNASAYGGDISRLAIAGESAGGNLTIGLMIAACYQRPEPYAQLVWQTGIVPAAVQSIAGLLQVSHPRRFAKLPQGKMGIMGDFSVQVATDVAKAYIGRDIDGFQEKRALADPLVILEKAGPPQRPLPPIFAAVGTADIVCNDTERLQKALIEKKYLIKVSYYPDEPHVFHFMFWREIAADFWKEAIGFLHKHIALTAEI